MIQPQPIRPVPDDEPERPEEGQMRGILPIRIGSETRYVPTLKRARSHEWKQRLARSLFDLDVDIEDDVEVMVKGSTMTDDLVYEHVLAFDHTNALGGREYLDEAADDRDIYDAFDLMLRSVSPKADDPVAGFVNQMSIALSIALGQRFARSASARSTSGSPADTAGTPTPLTIASPTNSTNSSGTTVKRQRRAKPTTSATA